jgi:hypothetical protein
MDIAKAVQRGTVYLWVVNGGLFCLPPERGAIT